MEQFSEKLTDEQEVLAEIDSEYLNKKVPDRATPLLDKLLNNTQIDFGKQLSYEYMKEVISFQIPSQENAFFLEAKWGAALTFSNMPFDDFLFVFTALFLEHRLVFLSKNVTLLTSTILTFFALLKPFKWPHPMIFNIPESLLQLFDAPVPILVGLNQGIEFIKENKFNDQNNSCVFLSLDDNEILLNAKMAKEIGLSIPNFGNFKKDLKPLYEKFNADKSRSFSYGFKKGSKQKKKLICTPSPIEETDAMSICQYIRELLFKNIVMKLPADPKFLDKENKLIDVQDIQKCLINTKSLDEQFLTKFADTQIFTFFLEEHYEISSN